MSEAEPKGATPEPTSQPTGQFPTRDVGSWAKPVTTLTTPDMPTGAVNLNVAGRHLSGPLMGFGQMWQKTYRIPLRGVSITPAQVVAAWKENFPKFWPAGNRFYGAAAGIEPGQVAVLNMAGPGGMTAPGGGPLISTGIMVIFADDESFSFMTPQGHMFAGMITFSAERDTNPGGGAEQAEMTTYAQVQALVRASDPIYEIGSRLGVMKEEDRFWQHTLTNLAASFGVQGQVVSQQTTLVDPKMQWGHAGNVWHNAAIRTGWYTVAAPVRWARGLVTRGQ